MGTNDPAYKKRWTYDRHRGIKRLVPAEPVRAHIQHLEDLELSRRAVADLAGVSPTTITTVMGGQHPSVQRRVAEKILGVRADQVMTRQRELGFVPAVGARRRIRALFAIGHTAASIAAVIDGGKSYDVHNTLNHPGRWITRTRHDDIAAAYEQLWGHPGTSVHNRSRAARFGWLPPLAWDDDTIDRPDPALDDLARTHATLAPTTTRRRQDLVDDVTWYLREVDALATAEHLAHRFGYADRSGIQNALVRAGQPGRDLLARLARNADLAGHSNRRKTA